MEWLGELERAFATSLYPLRVPIAIGLVLGLIGFVAIAKRRGWFAAARRHPTRAIGLVLALLVVGGPVAWYLGSPLFIRTALVEPAPTIASTPDPGAPDPTSAISSDVPASQAPTQAPPTTAPPRSGSFTGADDFHFGRGTATLIETEPGRFIVRFEDFSVRNGPDLYVYLSPDPGGYAKGAVELGRLKATDGEFNTKVPAGTAVTKLRSVVIWCKQFAVQFAVAPLA
jgi:electron transfer DM13